MTVEEKVDVALPRSEKEVARHEDLLDEELQVVDESAGRRGPPVSIVPSTGDRSEKILFLSRTTTVLGCIDASQKLGTFPWCSDQECWSRKMWVYLYPRMLNIFYEKLWPLLLISIILGEMKFVVSEVVAREFRASCQTRDLSNARTVERARAVSAHSAWSGG